MADHFEDFPFEEIRAETGDYFPNIKAVMAAGYEGNQIWSVTEAEGTYTYGPPHHYVNLVGYVATKEPHDGDTYYHEEPDLVDC